MKKQLRTTLWMFTLAFISSTSAYAGITLYNPATNSNEAINTSSSISIGGGVRQAVTAPSKPVYNRNLNNRSSTDPYTGKTTIVRNKNTVDPVSYNRPAKKKIYGELLVFMRPADAYTLKKLAALSRLFGHKGLQTEYYSADLNPAEIQRNMIRNNKAADSYSGPMPTQAKMNFYVGQIEKMPAPSVDAGNMLATRYNIRAYPAVIYTDPNGKITTYDFSTTKSSNNIVEQILSKIEYIKRGIK